MNKVGTSKNGFTIVELLVVIVVIAILAAITIVSYNGIQARALANSYEVTAQSIIKKAEILYQQTGAYPHSRNLFPTDATNPATLPSSIKIAYTDTGTNSMFNRMNSVATDPAGDDVQTRSSSMYKNSTTGVITFIARECPYVANGATPSAGTGFRIFYADPTDPDILDQKTLTIGTGCT